MFSDPQHTSSQFEILPNQILADFGCGVGRYAIEMGHSLHGTGKVYAIDVNDDLLAKTLSEARAQRIHNIQPLRADIERVGGVPLHDGILDGVVLANTLFQTKMRENVLKEAARLLKKGGKLFLIDWADSSGGIGPHPEQLLPEFQARQLLEKAGFAYYKSMTAGDHHYGLVFKKS